jgi:hypothetical protein
MNHQSKLNRIAEVHFFLRPILSSALKKQIITEEGRKLVGDYQNYHELWLSSFGDLFFDMATAIRLGSEIESNLKYYYMDKKGYTNIPQLKADSNYKQNIFQRVQSWQNDGVISLYQREIGYDLTNNPHLQAIQEAMMHRHLYAHSSGIIDDDYINKIKKITGQDISTLPEISASYPANDTYWFKPLKKLEYFIEETRNFFDKFP